MLKVGSLVFLHPSYKSPVKWLNYIASKTPTHKLILSQLKSNQKIFEMNDIKINYQSLGLGMILSIEIDNDKGNLDLDEFNTSKFCKVYWVILPVLNLRIIQGNTFFSTQRIQSFPAASLISLQ